MRKTIFLIIFILVFYIFISNFISNKISNDTIRIRVIANSNLENDQKIKYEVSDSVLKYLDDNIDNKSNSNLFRKKIINSLGEIKNIINDTLVKNNVNQSFSVTYGYNYFPKKELNNIIYEEGNYESLYIVLGEGLGENFWCLLFPPFCFVEAEDSENVEYTTISKEIYNFVDNKF